MARKYEPVIGTTYRVGFQRTDSEKHCWRCLAKTQVEMVGRGDATGGGIVKVPVCHDHAVEAMKERGLALQSQLEEAFAALLSGPEMKQ